MTIEGAIAQLQELIDNDEIPFWAKPSLQKVMETVEMEREQRIKALQERKEAEWLPEEFFPYKGFYCSNSDCMEKVYEETPYCPYCGAKMKGEGDETD